MNRYGAAAGLAIFLLGFTSQNSFAIDVYTSTVVAITNIPDFANDIVLDKDENIYLAGVSEATSHYDRIWVGKLTPQLGLVNSFLMEDSSALTNQFTTGITIAPNGDIYVLGETGQDPYNRFIWLGRFDSSLSLKNSKTLSDPRYAGTHIQSDTHGNLFVSGYLYENFHSNFWVAKFDSDMVLIDSVTIPNVHIATALLIEQNGDIVVGGDIYDVKSNTRKIVVLKFDSSLQLKPVSYMSDSMVFGLLNDVAINHNNEVIIVGERVQAASSKMEMWVLKLDQNLQLISMKELPIGNGANGVVVGPHDEIFITGQAYSNDGDIFLAQLTSDLVIQSSMTIYGSGNDNGDDIAIGKDSVYVTGWYNSGEPRDDNIWVSRHIISGQTYSLTVTQGVGSGSYSPGTIVSIGATNIPNDQKFLRWQGADDNLFVDPLSRSTSFTMPNKNVVLTFLTSPTSGVFSPDDAQLSSVFSPGGPPIVIPLKSASPNSAEVTVYNKRGQEIRNLYDEGGQATWDGKNNNGETVATDIYLVVIKLGGTVETKKVAVVK